MAKEKKTARAFTLNEMTIRQQIGERIFGLVKKANSCSEEDVSGEAFSLDEDDQRMAEEFAAKKIITFKNTTKGKIATSNDSYAEVAGIGFSDGKCRVILMGMSGMIRTKEIVDIGTFADWRGRSREISELVEEIASRSKIRGTNLKALGIAVPEEMSDVNPNAASMLAEGIQKIFKADTYTCNASVAAAYAERDALQKKNNDDMIYLHSDIGTGVILRQERIYEASHSRSEAEGEYLRPWKQYGLAHSAKELVNRGIGTDMVNMVNGDVDSITLDIVLEAAEKGDELAGDLVRRAGLALGVRMAYLINMFRVPLVVIGGGVEKKKGGFVKDVKESQERFLLKEIREDVEILPATLGEEASSLGAAALCRRELFMEV